MTKLYGKEFCEHLLETENNFAKIEGNSDVRFLHSLGIVLEV